MMPDEFTHYFGLDFSRGVQIKNTRTKLKDAYQLIMYNIIISIVTEDVNDNYE